MVWRELHSPGTARNFGLRASRTVPRTDKRQKNHCESRLLHYGGAACTCTGVKNGLIEKDGIVADCKSGVTGAGRKPTQNTHYPELNEGMSAYKVAVHRHTPEIEQSLSHVAGTGVKVVFVPHLLPVNRGILATCYARLKPGVTAEQVNRAYHKQYDNEYFIRLLPQGREADIKNVRYSNFCDISLHADSRTNTLIAISAIDNMVKGAAGQAIQNMNLVFGVDETAGLKLFPPAF